MKRVKNLIELSVRFGEYEGNTIANVSNESMK